LVSQYFSHLVTWTRFIEIWGHLEKTCTTCPSR